MLLQIQGYHLPGPAWQSDDAHYDNVHVGIQLGKEPRELVRADSQTSSWTIPIEVVAREGGLDFRGAAVQGRAGARFVYLTSHRRVRRAAVCPAHAARINPGAGRRLTRRVNHFRRERAPAGSADTATPPGDRPARTARAGPQPC